MSISSIHHSFDIQLASKYGIECALIIHHFQHWIRINRVRKKNIRDERCWTYQTREDIRAHFPYLKVQTIRYFCEKLVKLGVLMTDNYNKNAYDRTLWYAFVDEKAFGVDADSNPLHICENSQMESKNLSNEKSKSLTPIPDTKTDPENKEREEGPESQAEEQTASPFLATAKFLSDFFLEKIKERNPKFRQPNLNKWSKEFEKILRIDLRPEEEIKDLIFWASGHKWWKNACLCPEKLRKDYDLMFMQKSGEEEKDLIRRNRNYAVVLKEDRPNEMKGLTFDDKYAINRATAKEIPFNLPEETFRAGLVSMFGGTYGSSDEG